MTGKEGTNNSNDGVLVLLMKAGCDGLLANAATKRRVNCRRRQLLRGITIAIV